MALGHLFYSLIHRFGPVTPGGIYKPREVLFLSDHISREKLNAVVNPSQLENCIVLPSGALGGKEIVWWCLCDIHFSYACSILMIAFFIYTHYKIYRVYCTNTHLLGPSKK
jgi:hypothetical protein